jgi:hypothetical protein
MQSGAAAFGSLVVLGIVAVVVFAVFLLMREVWCWYWKINRALEMLHELTIVLRNIDKHIAAQMAGPRPQSVDDHFGPIR